MSEISLGLQKHHDKVERVVPWISKWMTPLGLISWPSWPVGPSGMAWDDKAEGGVGPTRV